MINDDLKQTPERWHHRPERQFVSGTAYMVTAATLHKQPYFDGEDRLAILHDALLELAGKYDWSLQAWAVFNNHYHWVGLSPPNAQSLRRFVGHLHTHTARALNRLDATPGRKVWFQYWDTCLTFEASYFARLHYTHENAAHHGLVPVAEQYAFCSASWFAAHADPTFYRKVKSYKYDCVNVRDDF